MKLTIVTPWRGHRELERDYWAAVLHEGADVLVVDDGSDPPLPNGVRVEPSGFSAACNAGLAHARTDAVLFLNNDVHAPLRGWLEPIRAALEPGVLVGAELRTGALNLPYLDGWCVAGMTEDLRALGGWDESFDEPSYYGDNDLSLRARAAGMRLREARTTLRHKRNVTAGTATDPAVRAASAANLRRFEERARELEAVPA